jgi:glucarate dehydratase
LFDTDTVAAVRATPINVPLEAPYATSAGVFPGFSKAVVEVLTRDGAVGIGEAPNASLAGVVTEVIGPRLAGADPCDLADCERRCLPAVQAYRNTEDMGIVLAYGGVEMALWDLIGKLQGRSVAQVLGGRVREQIEFTEYFAMRLRHGDRGGEDTPVAVAEYCASMVELHGARHFEGKAGVAELATEVAIAKEVRAAIGYDRTLRFDANRAWPLTVAREAMRRFEPFNISSFEEPVQTLDELARLRATTTIAFSSHDPDLHAAQRLGVPDAFVINLAVLGGIRRTIAFIHACEELGFEVWFYSDPGIATSAYLQVAAAIPHLSRPHQTLGRWLIDDVIEGGPLRPDNGVLAVPDKPGLGVTLDPDGLARCHERFRQEGPYDQYAGSTMTGRYVR